MRESKKRIRRCLLKSDYRLNLSQRFFNNIKIVFLFWHHYGWCREIFWDFFFWLQLVLTLLKYSLGESTFLCWQCEVFGSTLWRSIIHSYSCNHLGLISYFGGAFFSQINKYILFEKKTLEEQSSDILSISYSEWFLILLSNDLLFVILFFL